MNTREKGRLRDEKILRLVDRFGCLTTSQVARAIFSGRSGMASCQRRLRTLVDRGDLRRTKPDPGGQYVYSRGGFGQVRHKIEVASVYLKIRSELRLGETFDMLPEYPLAGAERADALIIWLSGRDTALAFLEVQRSGFAQLGKYQRYLLEGEWRREPWAVLDAEGRLTFPRIIVIGAVKRSPARLTVVTVNGSVRKAVWGEH